MWKMLHEKNAIEGAALTVKFSEPLSSLVTKKAIRSLEAIASREGFLDKQPMHQIQFQIGQQAPDIRQSPTGGMAFLHNSLARDAAGNVTPQLARQFTFSPDSMVMQIPRYRGWEIEWPATRKMFDSAGQVASEAVTFSSFRLEYLNRFIFDGPPEEADVAVILQRSNLIIQQAFSSSDLWHSHVGYFDDISDTSRRLVQVNADMQTLNAPHFLAGNRTLALMIALERQFAGEGLEVDSQTVEKSFDQHFANLHADVYELLKAVVDSHFATINGLPQ